MSQPRQSEVRIVGLEEILTFTSCLMIKHSGPAVSWPRRSGPSSTSEPRYRLSLSDWFLYTNIYHCYIGYADVESWGGSFNLMMHFIKIRLFLICVFLRQLKSTNTRLSRARGRRVSKCVTRRQGCVCLTHVPTQKYRFGSHFLKTGIRWKLYFS